MCGRQEMREHVFSDKTISSVVYKTNRFHLPFIRVRYALRRSGYVNFREILVNIREIVAFATTLSARNTLYCK